MQYGLRIDFDVRLVTIDECGDCVAVFINDFPTSTCHCKYKELTKFPNFVMIKWLDF